MKNILLPLLFALAFTSKAAAQSCSANATDISFGAVDLITGASYSTSGAINISCKGEIGKKIRVCINLNSGDGGKTSATSRTMLNGGDPLAYNMYLNAGMATVYGSYTWADSGSYPGVSFVNTVPSTGYYTLNSSVYAKIMPSQTNAKVGNYFSNFGGIEATINYDYNDTLPCSSLPRLSSPLSFRVSATVLPSCVISASDIDFGTTNALTSNTDASTLLRTRCTNGAVYSIGLDGGIAGASSGGVRKMLNTSNTAAVYYNLFRDVARAQPWGTTIGTNTLDGIGNGVTLTSTIYGRIAPQTTPSPGTYSDRITVVVTY